MRSFNSGVLRLWLLAPAFGAALAFGLLLSCGGARSGGAGKPDTPAVTEAAETADAGALPAASPQTPVAPAPSPPSTESPDIPEIETVFVEGGTFTMGCTSEQEDDCEDNERPAHSVTVGNFQIGKYEVTQRLWVTVMGSNPLDSKEAIDDFRESGFDISNFKGDNLPIVYVSWNEVQEFIKKLNTALGKSYRLPTESEWEFAARGGAKSKGYKYSGSNNLGDVGWYYENSGDEALDDNDWSNSNLAIQKLRSNNNRFRPVGTKRPNELGIYDMSGNVLEWVNDLHEDYTALSKSNPTGPERGSARVIRGGCWNGDAWGSRVSNRGFDYPDFRYYYLGFRLAVSP